MRGRLQLSIRPYDSADWDAVRRVHDGARPQELARYVPREAIRPLDEATAKTDGLFRAQTFVAETVESSRVVGFASIEPPELTWLYVDPGFQRQGVARSLIQHVLPAFGPDGCVICAAENGPALATYGAFGFSVAARFPGETMGFPCEALRLCLPGSKFRDQPPKPAAVALALAGYTMENPGQPLRDPDGVWRWAPATSDSVLIGGTEKREIRIMVYDPDWPAQYEAHARRIAAAVGPSLLDIHHVGSTSVPGLAAKAIIDILVIVANSALEETYLPALEAAGYELRVREPDWYEHRMLRTREKDVHIHVFSPDSPEIRRNLGFRDWLRANAADRNRYEQVKRQLATESWMDMNAYARAKTDIIEKILAMALGDPRSQ